MAFNDKKRTEKVSLFNPEGGKGITVEEYFAKVQAQEEKLRDYRRKVDEERLNKERKTRERLVKDFYEKMSEAGIQSSEEVEAYRKKLIEEQDKKEKQNKLKAQRELLSATYKIETKQDKQKKKEDLAARKKENADQLEYYNKLKKKRELTPEEKEDMELRKKELKQTTKNEWADSLKKALTSSLDKLTSAIDSGISSYAKYQAGINARLQGYRTLSEADKILYGNENYFGALENRLTTAVGITPFFKTEKMLDNLQVLVEAGIASNLDQRAFIQTAKDDIATTFNAADSALLRIIRLQQSDSTAARLGMEAYLTRFLNSMVQNTEYLTSTFDSVANSLLEASSQMTSEASAEFEYVVQKWLGMLSGVGLSEETATGIGQALGYLGSGNVEALSGSNLQNLLVMAASRSGLSYADLLSSGLTAQKTDVLMNSLVKYMAEIGSSGNNVVRSQFAKTFGLNISDITAAKNLSNSLGDITGNLLSFSGMYDELGYQLSSVGGRLSMSNMIDTLFANLEFGLASNIAANPALAALWKVNSMIEQATGGINIPAVFAVGTGADLNATVNQLAKLGLVGVSSLGLIGDLISGVGNTINAANILDQLGISASDSSRFISRGTGLQSRSKGMSTSISTYTGNVSGSDIAEGSIALQSSKAKQEVSAAVAEDENTEAMKRIPDIHNYLISTLEEHMKVIEEKVSSLEDKVVNGEIEIANNIGDPILAYPLV